jgi:hypothetical protein
VDFSAPKCAVGSSKINKLKNTEVRSNDSFVNVALRAHTVFSNRDQFAWLYFSDECCTNHVKRRRLRGQCPSSWVFFTPKSSKTQWPETMWISNTIDMVGIKESE